MEMCYILIIQVEILLYLQIMSMFLLNLNSLFYIFEVEVQHILLSLQLLLSIQYLLSWKYVRIRARTPGLRSKYSIVELSSAV